MNVAAVGRGRSWCWRSRARHELASKWGGTIGGDGDVAMEQGGADDVCGVPVSPVRRARKILTG